MYLNCKTNFSFRYGTLTAEELVVAGVDLGVSSMALTNINSTCDTWDFVQSCIHHGIKPVVGVEIRNGHRLLYILIAVNNKGFASINQFLSIHLHQQILFPETPGSESSFLDPADVFIIYDLDRKKPQELHANEYIGIAPWELNKLYGSKRDDSYAGVSGKRICW